MNIEEVERSSVGGSAIARSSCEQPPTERDAVCDVIARGAVADVQGEHSGKRARARFEDPHRVLAKTRMAARQQHQARHHRGTAKQTAMLKLIACEIVVGETISQQRGLAKSEAKAFARDRIDSAGGVSDERDVVAIYVMQSSADGDRSALAGGGFGVLKTGGRLGKICEGGIEPQGRIRADERDADFIGAYGRDVDLRVILV